MASAISWFQIPASRHHARQAVLRDRLRHPARAAARALPAWRCGGSPPTGEKEEISGALVCGEGAVPSATGTAVFLNADPDLQVMLDRVEAAGGRILIAKTAIGMEGAGHFAMIADTEGNTVGLYSRA